MLKEQEGSQCGWSKMTEARETGDRFRKLIGVKSMFNLFGHFKENTKSLCLDAVYFFKF